jgi:hypothetical protein
MLTDTFKNIVVMVLISNSLVACGGPRNPASEKINEQVRAIESARKEAENPDQSPPSLRRAKLMQKLPYETSVDVKVDVIAMPSPDELATHSFLSSSGGGLFFLPNNRVKFSRNNKPEFIYGTYEIDDAIVIKYKLQTTDSKSVEKEGKYGFLRRGDNVGFYLIEGDALSLPEIVTGSMPE